jgi:hypothetical protein
MSFFDQNQNQFGRHTPTFAGGAMSKETREKTYDELAQDMCTREDHLVHVSAKAEMARRAAVRDRLISWIMLASVLIAAVAAVASAYSAYFAYLSSLHK